jgi:hypothetical protein
LQSVWQYSFYRVVATALCFVASGVWTTFESRLIHGDYSLANFVFILPKMIAITVGLIWLVLRIGTMVSDLFKAAVPLLRISWDRLQVEREEYFI